MLIQKTNNIIVLEYLGTSFPESALGRYKEVVVGESIYIMTILLTSWKMPAPLDLKKRTI